MPRYCVHSKLSGSSWRGHVGTPHHAHHQRATTTGANTHKLAAYLYLALEAPHHTTAQKMLAHRIAQAYGLQTSTVDYEDGRARVIGTRTVDTRLRRTKV